MSLKIRRVVTGHDANGRAIVVSDAIHPTTTMRPKVEATVPWSTEGFPVNNDDPTDGGLRGVSTAHHNGTVFRIVSYEPGCTPRNHRTDSIDYGIVLQGEMHMELDDGVVVVLKKHDVCIQRGTIHNWNNKGPETCIIAFVLIDAKPAMPGGKPLPAHG